MIRAFLNSKELTLFPDTAIGLTIENFNISDMTNRKIDRTNVIQVPKAGNETAFEFASIPNAPTDFAYNDFDFDLIVDGVIVYENGRAFIIGEDADSYTLNVTNNKNIIDLLKSINLADLYTGDTITLATTVTWPNLFKQATNGFRIDYMFREGNPAADTFGSVSALTSVSIYVTTIIAKIVADFDITFSGDLLSDADYLEFRIPMTNGNIRKNFPATDFLLDEIIIHGSFTAWDLIKNILQLTCSVFKVTGTNMEIQKFNDLDVAAPIDWSGKLVSSSKKFAIPGAAQKNYIKHNVGQNVDPLYLAAIINCNNENIDFETDLATMKDKTFQLRDVFDNYTNASVEPLFVIQLPDVKDVPNTPSTVSPVGYTAVADMQIIVDSPKFLGQPLAISMTYLSFTAGTWTYDIENDNLTNDSETTIVEYYDPTPNYSLVETMLTDPVMYEAELLLNIVDINSFDHFKGVRIDELEGIFYVNKIIDFLATSPGEPTKVELIKVS